MKKIKLEIVGLSYSQTQQGAFALVLGEVSGKRRLPIIIGGFEAQAIAIEVEKMIPARPLTHDLFKSLSTSFDIKIDEVIIYNLVEGVFFAKLVCSNGAKNVEIDARTSDAIALAVRYNCPVYTYEFILSSAGIQIEGGNMDSDTDTEEAAKPVVENKPVSLNSYGNKSDNELRDMLERALAEESYETAARIRDELDKRQKN